MLSVFPGLLNYPLIGIFILRAALGLVFLKFGLEIFFQKRKAVEKLGGFFEIICGTLLILGLFTQPSALFALLITLTAVIFKAAKTGTGEVFPQPLVFYALLAAVSVSLVLLGPGAFSVDLPL